MSKMKYWCACHRARMRADQLVCLYCKRDELAHAVSLDRQYRYERKRRERMGAGVLFALIALALLALFCGWVR